MTFDIEGLKELEDLLLGLAEEYGPKEGVAAIRPALKAASAPLEEAIRTATPRITGTLANSTKTRIGKPTKKMLSSPYYNSTAVIASRVGWTWGRPSLWRQALAVEFGTTEMSGSATLRTALDRTAEGVLTTFGKNLGAAIEKRAKTLAKKRRK